MTYSAPQEPDTAITLGQLQGNASPDWGQRDAEYLWHPFTVMREWVEREPLVIDSAQGVHLIDTEGRRYFDGVSSLWCNVHGHRHPVLDQAIRDQLDKVAHTTLLGLASPPSIALAAELVAFVNRHLGVEDLSEERQAHRRLNKVFYTDSGATAVEVALKMAVGYWHHTGRPNKTRFIRLGGSYHGDTVGSMSVGYSELFHRPFRSMVFGSQSIPEPDVLRMKPGVVPSRPNAECSSCEGESARCQRAWPSECEASGQAAIAHAKAALDALPGGDFDPSGLAAVVIEPVMQGAAGMVCQPPGFLRMIRDWCDANDVLLIADEVATGFGRTGKMFACAHDSVVPDILCLAKGLTGGYLPVAATLCRNAIEHAFRGQAPERRALYHGHTYTGNPLGCAVALASLRLWDQKPYALPDGTEAVDGLLAHTQQLANAIAEELDPLRDHPFVMDVRQRGLMTGIELGRRPEQPGQQPEPFDFSKRTAAAVCAELRGDGYILRPLGDVMVLMPIPATPEGELRAMLRALVAKLQTWDFGAALGCD